MDVNYIPCHRDHAEGYISMDKPGAGTFTLVGCAAMSQGEMNFLGNVIAEALSNLTETQMCRLNSFRERD